MICTTKNSQFHNSHMICNAINPHYNNHMICTTKSSQFHNSHMICNAINPHFRISVTFIYVLQKVLTLEYP